MILHFFNKNTDTIVGAINMTQYNLFKIIEKKQKANVSKNSLHIDILNSLLNTALHGKDGDLIRKYSKDISEYYYNDFWKLSLEF